MELNPNTLHKTLRSLVNKFLNSTKMYKQFASTAAIYQNDMVELLRASGKEKITITIQGDKKISVINREVPIFKIKDDATSILRRKLTPELIRLVVQQKEIVDVEQLKKLIELQKIPDDILGEIMDAGSEEKFEIEVEDVT